MKAFDVLKLGASGVIDPDGAIRFEITEIDPDGNGVGVSVNDLFVAFPPDISLARFYECVAFVWLRRNDIPQSRIETNVKAIGRKLNGEQFYFAKVGSVYVVENQPAGIRRRADEIGEGQHRHQNWRNQ